MADHEVAAGGGEGNARGAVVWAQLGGLALVLVASVLLVYLGAVLLARLGVWAFYP